MSTTQNHLVRGQQARITETPNAVMTTLASPTASESAGLSMWSIEMAAGQQGPVHVFETEQIWTVLRGEISVDLGGDLIEMAAGDAITFPGGVVRQVTAVTAVGLLACGLGDAVARVPGEDASRGTPPWIA